MCSNKWCRITVRFRFNQVLTLSKYRLGVKLPRDIVSFRLLAWSAWHKNNIAKGVEWKLEQISFVCSIVFRQSRTSFVCLWKEFLAKQTRALGPSLHEGDEKGCEIPLFAPKIYGSTVRLLVLSNSALVQRSLPAKLQQYGVYFEDFLWLFAR